MQKESSFGPKVKAWWTIDLIMTMAPVILHLEAGLRKWTLFSHFRDLCQDAVPLDKQFK